MTHVNKSGERRERAGQVALDMLFISAGVLVIADWIEPSLRVGRLGSCMLLVAGMIYTKRLIDRKLSKAWAAGERSGRRHAELEADAQPQLAVVRDMARPR